MFFIAIIATVMADSWPRQDRPYFYSDLITKNSNVYLPLYAGDNEQLMRVYLNTLTTDFALISDECMTGSAGRCDVANKYNFSSATTTAHAETPRSWEILSARDNMH